MLRDRQVSWQQNMSSSTPSSSYDPFYDPHDKYSKAPRIRPITGCSFMCCLWCILIGAAVFYYGIIDIEMVAPEGSTVHTYLHGLYSDTDRSRIFNIKVLPSNVQEKTLDSLPQDAYSYAAVIDAGSSGCRAHVYRFGKLGTITGPLYILPQHISKKIKPGLSSFVNDYNAAGPSLNGLVLFLKEQIPESQWSKSPIWLFATAGLRMLDTKDSTAILGSVQNYLSDQNNSPFLFHSDWARIISGKEEGGYGWIAYNYLKQIIGPKKNKDSNEEPYAVVEMGGASLQVSQQAQTKEEIASVPPEHLFKFTIEKDEYTLYVHSYLGYGAEQAREKLNTMLSFTANGNEVVDPCLNPGYSRDKIPPPSVYEGISLTNGAVKGGSNTNSCGTSVNKALFSHDYSSCTKSKPYGIGCVSQPSFIPKSKNILIFENFFYTSSALAVPSITGSTQFPLVTTASLLKQKSSEICSTEWSKVQSDYPKDGTGKDVNIKLCFTSSFAVEFLLNGLKVDEEKSVTVQREVGGNEIEWALGAAYKNIADYLKKGSLRHSHGNE